MERKAVWINGKKIFILPWAKVWDALLAAPESDLLDVWRGRAFLLDEYGALVAPDDGVRSGQKIFVRRYDEIAS